MIACLRCNICLVRKECVKSTWTCFHCVPTQQQTPPTSPPFEFVSERAPQQQQVTKSKKSRAAVIPTARERLKTPERPRAGSKLAKIQHEGEYACHCGGMHYRKLLGSDMTDCRSCHLCLVGRGGSCDAEWTCVHCRRTLLLSTKNLSILASIFCGGNGSMRLSR